MDAHLPEHLHIASNTSKIFAVFALKVLKLYKSKFSLPCIVINGEGLERGLLAQG